MAAAVELPGARLSEVANALVQLKAEFYGRGPEEAKAYLNDNLLVVVLRGGFLDVEETMIQRDRADVVRDLRLVWEEELDADITHRIADLTGYQVLDYHSQVLVQARTVIELFLLAAA
jgi:uncharacterized protein YbcI